MHQGGRWPPNTQGGMQYQRQDSLGVFLRMTLRLVRPGKAQLLGRPASAASGTALADVSYHGQLDRWLAAVRGFAGSSDDLRGGLDRDSAPGDLGAAPVQQH